MSKIICPLCSKSFDRFKKHIVYGHKLDWNKFLDEHGFYPICSEEFSCTMRKVGAKADKEKIHEGLIKAFSSSEFKRKKAEATKRQWEDPQFKKLMVLTGKRTFLEKLKDNPRWVKTGESNALKQYLTDMHNGKHPEAFQKMIAGRNAYNHSPQCIEKLNQHWKDPEKIEKARERTKRNNRGTMLIYSKADGLEIKLRSKLESKIAKELDNLKISWEYEKIIIPYTFNDKIHHYITDFYLPQYNYILEVKPKFAQNEEIVLAKKKASEDLGYSFSFISCPEELSEIFEEGVTTIESIAKN